MKSAQVNSEIAMVEARWYRVAFETSILKDMPDNLPASLNSIDEIFPWSVKDYPCPGLTKSSWIPWVKLAVQSLKSQAKEGVCVRVMSGSLMRQKTRWDRRRYLAIDLILACRYTLLSIPDPECVVDIGGCVQMQCSGGCVRNTKKGTTCAVGMAS